MAKKLLNSGNCFGVTIFKNYHSIKPALVLYFENHKPIPIRDYRWNEYLPILQSLNIEINNPDNIEIEKFL